MKFATAYTAKNRPTDFATYNHKPTLTVQADKREQDINVIMARYSQSGQLPRINSAQPQTGDFTGVTDYREALDLVRAANEQFNSLPATVRKRFGNDPTQFLAFVNDEKNAEEAAKLGLTNPKPEPTIGERTLEQIQRLNENLTGDDDNGERPTRNKSTRHRGKSD